MLIAATHDSDDVNLVPTVAGRCDGLVGLAHTAPVRVLEGVALRIPVVLLAAEAAVGEQAGVLGHLLGERHLQLPGPPRRDGLRQRCLRRSRLRGRQVLLRRAGHRRPAGSTFCAPENGVRSFTSPATVAYGAGSSFTQKSLTSGTPCDNEVFGDPDYGVVKACFLLTAG